MKGGKGGGERYRRSPIHLYIILGVIYIIAAGVVMHLTNTAKY
jgi:hypothetical protein